MTILEVREEVEFQYPEDSVYLYRVPAGLTLDIGDAFCIFGVSGWGKSTVMTLLAALRRFDRGRIRYSFSDGVAVEVSPETWDDEVGPSLWSRIGFAFQRPELIRALGVERNLRLAIDGDAAGNLILFDEKEWSRIRLSRVWKISGGQTQRLGLLRAFGQRQQLVFLDEPTNNLDVSNRDRVARFVGDRRPERALVVVSHDLGFIASLGISRVFTIAEHREENRVIRQLESTSLETLTEGVTRAAVAAPTSPPLASIRKARSRG